MPRVKSYKRHAKVHEQFCKGAWHSDATGILFITPWGKRTTIIIASAITHQTICIIDNDNSGWSLLHLKTHPEHVSINVYLTSG